MHEKGGYKAEDIKEKPYQSLINETYKTFQSAITDNDIPPQMLAKLENDTFIFSGLRTHAQLLEASSFLRDEKGQIRNFDSFANQFNQVNKNYNQNYLEAEWQFAVNSSQSAANWAAIDENGRYNLQYRTANDDRVRADHAALQNITLPVDDNFWLSYYPPNGWRCRCTAVEVLKTKYEMSDSAKSNELGDRATTKIGPDGKNRMEIFRFNPGAEQKVFPPKHPYNKVENAKEVKDILEKQPDYQALDKNKRFAFEKDKVLDYGLDKVYKNLNVHESTSIFMYTMPDAYFGHLNNFNRFDKIRLGARADGFNRESLELMTNAINSGLDKIPDRYKGKVYRGADLTEEQFKAYKDAHNSKTNHIEKGFMSTTTVEGNKFQGNTVFIVESKNGAMIEKISAIAGENEVLFKNNQEFKVTNIVDDRNGRVIYMEEIN